MERHFGDQYQTVAYADFIADPVANPLGSESGKFEIYCQAKADMFNAAVLDSEEFKPYPTYHAFEHEEGYPLLMFNTHYPRSACTDFNNVETLRETFLAPVVMNSSRCVDCKTCQVACKKKFDVPKLLRFRTVSGFEVGDYPNARFYAISQACNHCENPACVRNCPTRAMYKDEQDGTVQHDDDRCIGCQACIMACPYGAPVYLKELGIVRKCNACIDTREEDGATTCEASCGMRAIEFGDFEELKAKHPDAVVEIACRPDPSITHPSMIISGRDYLQDEDFRDMAY